MPLDPLEDNPGGIMPVILEREAMVWRTAAWRQIEPAGKRNHIAPALSSLASPMSRPQG
ncbi:hypothetical protein [Burkholderia cenocepacia]|uniref:hypothetical protein n=1 Tax=Burkholderia cenocepacia TaxID=95486 RepID=UPI002ABD1ED5|nr:hypothetical protein [Burkholderia cenocepacia]